MAGIIAAAYAVSLAGFNDYIMSVGVSAAAFVILSAGFNLVYGYGGLLSLAQVTFWGLGGYTCALLSTRLDWNPWATLPVAGLVALGCGLLVGFASLRLSAHAFGIVTLIFSLLMQLVIRDWTSLTRGPTGIPGLPALELLRPWANDSLPLVSATQFYPLMLTMAVLVLWLLHRVTWSRVGLVLQAIKANEALAASQGIAVLRYRLFAFGASAFVSGGAGGLFVFDLSIADPTLLDFYYTESILVMVIVGGAGTFWPVVMASIVFSVVPELLRLGDQLRLVFYGGVLMAAILMFPAGVGGWLARRRLAAWRRPIA